MAPESLLALGFRCAQTSDTVRGRPPRPRLGRMWTAGNARRSGHGPTTGWRSASRSRQQCRRIQRRCRTGTRPVGADARQHPRSEYDCHVQTRAWRRGGRAAQPNWHDQRLPARPSETPGQPPANHGGRCVSSAGDSSARQQAAARQTRMAATALRTYFGDNEQSSMVTANNVPLSGQRTDNDATCI